MKLPVAHIVGQSRLIFGFFLVVSLLFVAVSAISFQKPELLGFEKVLTDFDAFHIAGTLAGRGDVANAYNTTLMLQAQAEITGSPSFMPWTYPPPFTLFVDLLADLPIGIAFALFILATFGFYLSVLHRISGVWLPGVMILMMPIIVLNLRTGQNGFLMAGLIGAFLLAWQDRKSVAGLPLGLMIIKPHLAVGAGLLALLGKRWDVVIIAALVALLAAALATFVYGFAVWGYFFGAVKEASTFLANGSYPMFRMSSVYAALLSLGLPSAWAMAGHVAGALVAVGLLVWVSLAKFEFRHRAALICALSVFISPYNYDYDLAILGIGLGFIAPDLAARASSWALAGVFVLAWLTGGIGVFVQVSNAVNASELDGVAKAVEPALICPLLIALYLAILLIMRSPIRGLAKQTIMTNCMTKSPGLTQEFS
ncbi:MAG: glycosyltransferase family 87 protein [Pseudomonadota bacterium]|nr:glycosyltransferase family 87 protein [Pseudomonadota bacterium]